MVLELVIQIDERRLNPLTAFLHAPEQGWMKEILSGQDHPVVRDALLAAFDAFMDRKQSEALSDAEWFTAARSYIFRKTWLRTAEWSRG